MSHDLQELEKSVMTLSDGWHYTGAGLPWVLVTRAGTERNVYVWANDARNPSVDELRRIFRLTPTQARVAQMLVTRRTNAEIAALLEISIHTVRRHVEAVLLRLGVSSRWEVEGSVYEATVRSVNEPVDRQSRFRVTRLRHRDPAGVTGKGVQSHQPEEE
jgi:DNA-binding CsgD family transcriptional regulator